MNTQDRLLSMIKNEGRRIIQRDAPYLLPGIKIEPYINTDPNKRTFEGRVVITFNPDAVFGIVMAGHVFYFLGRPIYIIVMQYRSFLLPYAVHDGKVIFETLHPFYAKSVNQAAQTALAVAGANYGLSKFGVKPKDFDTASAALNTLMAIKLNE